MTAEIQDLAEEIDGDEEFEDESFLERFVGLSEMLPEGMRNVTSTASVLGFHALKKAYQFTRSTMWITSTSFIILVLPVLFETEMAQLEQAQMQKQRQILLGPNAAMAGGSSIAGMSPPLLGTAVAQPPPGR